MALLRWLNSSLQVIFIVGPVSLIFFWSKILIFVVGFWSSQFVGQCSIVIPCSLKPAFGTFGILGIVRSCQRSDIKLHGYCASSLVLKTLWTWNLYEMQTLLSSEQKALDSPLSLQRRYNTRSMTVVGHVLGFLCGGTPKEITLVRSKSFGWVLLQKPLKAVIIAVAYGPFSTKLVPSTQLSTILLVRSHLT